MMIIKHFLLIPLIFTCLLAGCNTHKHSPIKKKRATRPITTTHNDGAPTYMKDVAKIPNATPKAEPKSRYGNPDSYVALGKRYHVMKSAKGYDKTGIASWYGTKFHGKLTSSREPYDLYGMTAASTSLPLPTYVKVTNLENGRTVIVKINDRGPFKHQRIIDLSYAAAKKLGYLGKGTAHVRVTAINPNQRYLAKAPKLPAPPSKTFAQVGVFSNKNNAQKLMNQLKQLVDNPIDISEEQREHAALYRVKIRLNTPKEFSEIQNLLASHGLDSQLTNAG